MSVALPVAGVLVMFAVVAVWTRRREVTHPIKALGAYHWVDQILC